MKYNNKEYYPYFRKYVLELYSLGKIKSYFYDYDYEKDSIAIVCTTAFSSALYIDDNRNQFWIHYNVIRNKKEKLYIRYDITKGSYNINTIRREIILTSDIDFNNWLRNNKINNILND